MYKIKTLKIKEHRFLMNHKQKYINKFKKQDKSNLRVNTFRENVFKNKTGSQIITAPLMIVLGILLVSILIVFAIKILSPYIWYEKLSSTCLKYIFIMEEYGYLTKKEEQHLQEELKQQGFEESNLKIHCTNKKQSYGAPIYLNINYIYVLELPIIGDREIQMNINRESVSKR